MQCRAFAKCISAVWQMESIIHISSFVICMLYQNAMNCTKTLSVEYNRIHGSRRTTQMYGNVSNHLHDMPICTISIWCTRYLNGAVIKCKPCFLFFVSPIADHRSHHLDQMCFFLMVIFLFFKINARLPPYPTRSHRFQDLFPVATIVRSKL